MGHSETPIKGLQAVDLQSLGPPLGASSSTPLLKAEIRVAKWSITKAPRI